MAMCRKPFGSNYPLPVGDDVDANPKFSRLHAAASNPDWMPALSYSQAVQARVVLPVNTSPDVVVNTSVPAAPPEQPSSSYMGFLNRVYRTANSSASSQEPARKAPLPPAALGEVGGDANATSMRPALPIDASIPVASNKKVSSPFPFPIGETSASLAMGGGMWGDLGSVSIPKATKTICSHPMAPLSIDSNFAGPKPLWGELPLAMSSLLGRRGDSAAVSSLFGTTAPRMAEASSSERLKLFSKVNLADEDTAATCAPAPPCPISTSPIRNAEAAAAAGIPTVGDPSAPQTTLHTALPQPLLPDSPTTLHTPAGAGEGVVGGISALEEDPSASLTFLTYKRNDTDALFPNTAPGFHGFHNSSAPETLGDTNNEKSSTVPTSPEVLGFNKSVEEPWLTRVAAQKQANVRNFLNTLFSSPMVPASGSDLGNDGGVVQSLHPESNASANGYSLEWAIRESIESSLNFVSSSVSQALASTRAADRSSHLGSSLDRLEDNSEEGLEHLRRVVSIVMQSAKQQLSSEEGGPAQWSGGGGPSNAGPGAIGGSCASNCTFENRPSPLFFGA